MAQRRSDVLHSFPHNYNNPRIEFRRCSRARPNKIERTLNQEIITSLYSVQPNWTALTMKHAACHLISGIRWTWRHRFIFGTRLIKVQLTAWLETLNRLWGWEKHEYKSSSIHCIEYILLGLLLYHTLKLCKLLFQNKFVINDSNLIILCASCPSHPNVHLPSTLQVEKFRLKRLRPYRAKLLFICVIVGVIY